MNREKQSFTTHTSAFGNSDISDCAGVTKLFAEPSLKSAGEFFGIAFRR
jgi:hypothetical protein